ncbi:MAG: hypothetical protein Q7T82_14505 [Armatimonadota bacterium]|nr:hypothetical protein [Armatimonadota bacterium]
MGALKASAGVVDLAPRAGMWGSGFALRVRPMIGTRDPITARTLLLDDGVTRLAVVSCDLLGFAPAAVADMRRRIAENSQIPGGNVLICCTHTHSGPTSMPMRGPLGHIDSAWLSEAQSRIVDMVSSLPGQLQPATFAYGSAMVRGIGHNRQDASHPIDEELVAVAVDSASGGPIATLLNYATHAVTLGPSNLQFSGDFPGAAARRLSDLRGGTGIYIQGACGDVDPVVYRDRGWGAGTFEDAERMGADLASAALNALEGKSGTADVDLRVSSEIVDAPLDPPPPPEELERIVSDLESERARCAAEGNAAMQTVIAAELSWATELSKAMAAGDVPESVPAEVFAAGINDLRLVGLPFETYSAIGLAIKHGLKPRKTIFAGYANGLYGYCPTRIAKDQGGYGPYNSCRWFPRLTPVGYGADDLLVEKAVALAGGL